MILSIFSFGFTWVLLAVAFYGLAQVVPGFHANYVQVIWSGGFKLGFVDAVVLKGVEMSGLSTFNPLLYVVFFALTFGLTLATNSPIHGFYVSGMVAPLVTASVMTGIAFALELLKEWYRRKEAA